MMAEWQLQRHWIVEETAELKKKELCILGLSLLQNRNEKCVALVERLYFSFHWKQKSKDFFKFNKCQIWPGETSWRSWLKMWGLNQERLEDRWHTSWSLYIRTETGWDNKSWLQSPHNSLIIEFKQTYKVDKYLLPVQT